VNLDEVRRCLEGDRFSAQAGIELLTLAHGHATAKMTLTPQHLNGLQTVHGGAIFTLADFTFAAACNSYGTMAVAINVSINFMKAASTGTLWAEAREVSKNFKIATYTVEVKDDSGDLVATFQGLAYRKKDRLPA
jgi:acyl-CoA thioesterase